MLTEEIKMYNENFQEEITFDTLFDLEEIQQIQDAFALAANVASIITAPEEHRLQSPVIFAICA